MVCIRQFAGWTNPQLSTELCQKKVRPQRVAAHRQQELLCVVMAFQELEWHAVNDVEFDGNVEDID